MADQLVPSPDANESPSLGQTADANVGRLGWSSHHCPEAEESAMRGPLLLLTNESNDKTSGPVVSVHDVVS